MNNTSSVVTGSATVAAAAISPLVDWLANGIMKLAMPAQVVLILSAALITAGHFAVNLINAKFQLQPGASAAPTRVTTQSGFAKVGMLAALAIAAAAMLSLSGCATAPGAQKPAPAQVIAQVCPVVQITMASLLVLPGINEIARDDLATAGPIVNEVCAGAETVDLSSVRRLADTALPALIRIANVAPIQQYEHDQIVLSLTVGQVVLAGVLQAAKPVAP